MTRQSKDGASPNRGARGAYALALAFLAFASTPLLPASGALVVGLSANVPFIYGLVQLRKRATTEGQAPERIAKISIGLAFLSILTSRVAFSATNQLATTHSGNLARVVAIASGLNAVLITTVAALSLWALAGKGQKIWLLIGATLTGIAAITMFTLLDRLMVGNISPESYQSTVGTWSALGNFTIAMVCFTIGSDAQPHSTPAPVMQRPAQPTVPNKIATPALEPSRAAGVKSPTLLRQLEARFIQGHMSETTYLELRRKYE